MNIREGKLLYHLTHIDNLGGIFEGNLLSRNSATQLYTFTDVADEEIIQGRQQHLLDDYVLFHFHPYSAFDVAVKQKYGPSNFVYITIQREVARRRGFQIIPRHPLNGSLKTYDYGEGINEIDWGAMEMKKSEIETEEEIRYARQVKMAECISSNPVLVSDFFRIYCNKVQLNKLQSTYMEHKNKFEGRVWLE